LEIVVSEEGNRVDLLLNHLATIVRIRKYENKFLDIFVQAPRRLLNMASPISLPFSEAPFPIPAPRIKEFVHRWLFEGKRSRIGEGRSL
jgi:hypothetical protein